MRTILLVLCTLVTSQSHAFIMPQTGIPKAERGPCQKIDSCSCRYEDGSIMDLRPLARRDGIPKYYRFGSPNQDYVYWNPCIPFSLEDTGCDNVAICTEVDGPTNQYVGYKDSTASYGFDNLGHLVLIYTTTAYALDREVRITLHCGGYVPDVFTPHFEQLYAGKVIYNMSLYSQYACGIQRTTEPPPTTAGITTGPPTTSERTTEPPPTTAKMTTEPAITTINPDQCKQTDLCSCRYSDGRTLSLKAVSKYDGTPFFENKPDEHGDLVSWNPCSTFTIEGTTCEDVFLCVASPEQSSTHVFFRGVKAELGVTFSVDEYDDQVITYHSVDKHGYFKTDVQVHLQCIGDSSPNFFIPDGQPTYVGDLNVFKMVLASKYACANFKGTFLEKEQP